MGVMGPETLAFAEVVRRVADLLGRRVLLIPMPMVVHRGAAVVFEATMRVPLMSRAQAYILAESVVDSVRAPDQLPPDLLPVIGFSPEVIRRQLPEPGRFRFSDLRCARS